jgi:hypothetical protein
LTEPLFLRLMSSQVPAPDIIVRYDPERDELLSLTSEGWRPAVDSSEGSPGTKKKDLEKGEDNKDRW